MSGSHDAAPTLFAATPLPMWILDEPAHAILDANEAALRRYGLTRAAALALDPGALVRPGLGRAFRAWVAAGDPGATEEFEQRTADGPTFAAELRVSPIRWAGRRARLVVVRDITQRQRVEERLRQSQKMEAVGRLAGSIAHDFNNLLTGIGAYADLLADELATEDPRRADALEIRRAVDRGSALTRQLLGFSRRQLVTPEVIDLNAAVRGMQPLLDRLLGERTRLVLGLRPAAGSVRIDHGQLEQVLLNLALNGRDAMPAGGRLLVETDRVELDSRYAARADGLQPGRYAVLAVSDEGEGISDEAREHLFEPFFTTKPRGSGTGLGLATVYGIVRQAGGAIDVFSQREFGTTFRVYLPVVMGVHSQPVSELPEPGRPTPDEPRTRVQAQVLVAEDDPLVRAGIVATLRRAGGNVAAAEDGAAALARLESGPPPDLLITDVRMPGLSGHELAKRARLVHPDLQILVITGHTGADTPDDLVRLGVPLLGKPFTADALLRAVRSALAPREPAAYEPPRRDRG